MPTPQQIQNTILSAQYQMATLVTANLNKLKVGNGNVKWAKARQFYRNIQALNYNYGFQNYNTTQTLQLYDCLNSLIGYDVNNATIDPNYQQANTTIIVNNPVPYLSPMDIPWSAFSTDGEVDGGRNTYYNMALAGINPFMQDQTTTLLYNGIDYDLIPSGGFILKTGGNLPFIYDGQSLRAYAYQFIGSVPSPIAVRIPQIFEDGSGTPLDNTYLNATYLYPQYIEGDIITVASVNLQYQRQNNSNPSLWNEEPFNYAG